MTVLDQLVLREEGVKLNLVDGRDDLPCLLQFLEIGNGPVGNTDGLDFARSVNLLHLAPSLRLVPVSVDRARAIRVHRQEGRGFVLR